MSDDRMIRGPQPYSAEEVYRKILRSIIHLELEPGKMISENKMAEEYRVSRSVIRTAFTRLQQLHLIEVMPQRGTYVSLIDLNHISDLLMLRTAVEKEVIYEMFTSLKLEDRKGLVKALDANLAEQRTCSNEKDYSGRFPKLDSQFHKTMIDSVGRYALVEILGDTFVHIARWRNFDVSFDSRIPELIQEHQDITDAIRNEDMAYAQDRMAKHLETISGIGERALAACPGYFKK